MRCGLNVTHFVGNNDGYSILALLDILIPLLTPYSILIS
jgi:hypothetical protein